MTTLICFLRIRQITAITVLISAWVICSSSVEANPTGGSVAQGSATFNASGSQFTVNQTSPYAFINWQSFNIGTGETTTFNQPSASAVTWNFINDASASSIDGTLNANGYVILQNPNGFMVGGSAAISAHGLIMTTASTPALNLSSGGPWSFDTPPPTAKIVNYGQINTVGGGSAFLIASDIQNHGTISAPGGKIGLYAGQTVLVSTAPDGRGLSAQITLPEGSVDNQGNLIADGGNIMAQAKVVNQSGLVQANSARVVNGMVELVGSDAVNLGASSVISAKGDKSDTSPGGSVNIQSGNSFSDQIGSVINVAGGQQGGDGGRVEISATHTGDIRSSINGQAVDGFTGGILTVDPANLWLASANFDGAAPSDYSVVNINSFNGLSQISLQADNNITLNTAWNLTDQSSAATLSLSAGNNITLNSGSDIRAGKNWTVSLTAGIAYSGTGKPASGSDGIFLNGSAYLQTQNGDISLSAANEVIVNSGAVRTLGGGNIGVTTEFGDVNTGTSTIGFNFNPKGKYPYYSPFTFNPFSGATTASSTLGGISTAAGGNVNITAGGDVISYPTSIVSVGDAGTGAFGSQPGNVSIKAGGDVTGHYVVMNGTGTINAGQDIGIASANVALSLAAGGWSLSAPNGSIYLQEVRNPNGVFDSIGSAGSGGNHLFDYDSQAFLELSAGSGVYLTGQSLPRPNGGVPLILPPTLNISAGSGGVNLQTPTAVDSSRNSVTFSSPDITLFPSAEGNLQIVTMAGGSFVGNTATLLMSDSAQTHWYLSNAGAQPFGELDHGSTPVKINNHDPVAVTIAGNMNNVSLKTDKATQIQVGGDMIGCSLYAQNLHPDDVTSINVVGQIINPGSFTSYNLGSGQAIQTLPQQDLPPNMANDWVTLLDLAINPNIANVQVPAGTPPSGYAFYLKNYYLFGGGGAHNNDVLPFDYNSATKVLSFAGDMSSPQYSYVIGGKNFTLSEVLNRPLTVVQYGANGYPLVDASGHFVTDTVTWAPAAAIDYLSSQSLGKPSLGNSGGGYFVGGTGQFDVNASAISLGNSYGIISFGNGNLLGADYSYLTPLLQTEPAATINVTVANDYQDQDGVTQPSLNMPSSTIAALGGGSVHVASTGGSMELGSPDLIDFAGAIMNAHYLGLGVYTTGGGNVNASALGNINIDSSRIATFNGGDIVVTSQTGDVNVGSGGSIAVPVNVFSPFAVLSTPFEFVYANGIAAETLTSPELVPGAATIPGDITVSTPQGNITANLGGIKQETLNGTTPIGPVITLSAGTPAVPGDFNSTLPPLYVGDIDLGSVGVIGETVIAQATGKITGLLLSRHNTSVTSQTVSGLTVLAGNTANISVQSAGNGSGITVIGGQGVNASGLGVGATVLGQNVSVNGGAATSTLGTAASSTAVSQSAAMQASTQAEQQVANNDSGGDDEKKKKKKKKGGLLRRVGRVTVILSAAD